MSLDLHSHTKAHISRSVLAERWAFLALPAADRLGRHLVYNSSVQLAYFVNWCLLIWPEGGGRKTHQLFV